MAMFDLEALLSVPEDCYAVLADPNVGNRANVYSCGQQKDQKAVHGEWWQHGVGCVDKKAGH